MPSQPSHGYATPSNFMTRNVSVLTSTGLRAQLTKALLVRGHARAIQNVDRLFELFDDEHVSWDAARAVGKIPATDKVLTKKNHAILRVRVAPGCLLSSHFPPTIHRIMGADRSQ